MMEWKFEDFLHKKFKLVEFKMDENFMQLIFKLIKFKSRNTINYTLKHEI
jgi:hypothetical protein